MGKKQITGQCPSLDLNSLSSRLPGHFYWKDMQGYYLGCSAGVLKLLELKTDNFIGKTDLQLWPKRAALLKEYDEQVVLTRNAITVEETILLDNGQQKIFLITRFPWINNNDQVIGIIGNLCDITLYKEKENKFKNELKDIQFELKKTKDELQATHKNKIDLLEALRLNIRSPIADIIHSTESINQETDNPKIKKYSTNLLESLQELQNFLNGILDTVKVTPIEREKTCLIPFQSVHEEKDEVEITEFLPNTTYDHTQILIVEDHPITAKITQKILSDLNCQVDLAMTGSTAIKKAQQNQYDLILMDIGLPDIDGSEVTLKIRLHESIKGKHRVPIVGLTARVDGESKQKCIESGMNAVFSKPLIKEKIQDIFMSYVPKHSGDTSSLVIPEILDEKIIDLKMGAQLIGGDEDLAKKAITMLVNSFPSEILRLENAYQKNDWTKIKEIIHKLRGGISYCGTPRLKEACIRLDEYLNSNEKTNEENSDLYQKLLKEMNAVSEQLNEWQKI